MSSTPILPTTGKAADLDRYFGGMQTIGLTSVGNLAAITQRHVSEIRRGCEQLGLQPAYRLNAVDYFSDQDCERLAEFFRRQDEPQSSR